MLNYIWAGLIVLSLVFALTKDFQDIRNDTYRNGAALPVVIKFEVDDTKPGVPKPVKVLIDGSAYESFYHGSSAPTREYPATLSVSDKHSDLRFAADLTFPEPLAKIRKSTTPADDPRLYAEVVDLKKISETTYSAGLRFQKVRFQTCADIATAAVDAAKFGVINIAFPLIGVIALWLGLTRIGEKAGLIALFNRMVRPFLRPLFPDVPPDHPAMGFLGLNLTANILGMGNAATPMGLKAMEELQTLNPRKDTATNAMVMLLAMHASSIQLLPPVMVIAVLGLRATNELLMPIWIVSAFGLFMGITAAILLGKLPAYQKSDPQKIAAIEAEVRDGSH